MDLGLEGKTALVGASSRGLGRAVADELAKEGANLVICARTVAPLEEAGQWIHDATGVEVVAVPADLSRPEDIDRLIKTAEEDFGNIDILVTNTGGPPPGPFEDHSVEAWSSAVEQNLNSVLNLTRAVLPAMKKAGWGRIINITSVAVKQPIDGLILSNAVRAAVTGFAKTLANEVASSGITVNNVMPGFTRTERLDGLAANISKTQGITVEEAFARWEGQSPASPANLRLSSRFSHPSVRATSPERRSPWTGGSYRGCSSRRCFKGASLAAWQCFRGLVPHGPRVDVPPIGRSEPVPRLRIDHNRVGYALTPPYRHGVAESSQLLDRCA